MSLIPFNIQQFKSWSVQQLYYLLFPYIKEDFMGREDCKSVHLTPNMTVVVSGSIFNVEHVIAGGSDNLASLKEAEYRILAQEGRVVTQLAEKTGQFTGVAR